MGNGKSGDPFVQYTMINSRVDVIAFFSSDDQAGVLQNAVVVRKGGFAQGKLIVEVTATKFPLFHQAAHNLLPGGVGQGFKHTYGPPWQILHGGG